MQLAAAQAPYQTPAAAAVSYAPSGAAMPAALPLAALAIPIAAALLPSLLDILKKYGIPIGGAVVAGALGYFVKSLLSGKAGRRGFRRKSKKVPMRLIENLMLLKMTGLPVTKGPGGAILMTKMGRYF